MKKYLSKIKQVLAELAESTAYPLPYFVPDITKPEKEVCANPFRFFYEKISEVEQLGKSSPVHLPAKNWTKQAVVYNMLVRYTTAYDHDQDGSIRSGANEHGLMETGTFLKAITLLPYIHSLGVNTIYLLPVTSIGKDNKKGNLGSPYSIQNPCRLDENLAEPFLDMTVEEQFAAFVEASHLLGMKVVLEFVFRTSSLDGDWALEHPEWYYWLKSEELNDYSAPKFSEDEIITIKEKVLAEDFTELIPPSEEFRTIFTDIPKKVFKRNGKIYGITKDGIECVIPPAFADWPPNDIQPPWSDVTFLRMYDHPHFNYIAYNTIRMYDEELKNKKYIVKDLWENITGIIPYYMEKFGIDGVMLDMGHALPDELRRQIVKRAKKQNPDFVFWEENFTLTEKSVKEGYEAVAGYMPFDEHVHWKLRQLVALLASNSAPLPFFLTPETHNTPRAAFRKGGLDYSLFCWALNCLLPGVLFIHSGFELGETHPVNTGLDFTEEETKLFPTESLPLFSIASLNWKSDRNITEFMKKILNIRNRLLEQNPEVFDEPFELIETNNEYILSFMFNAKKENLIFIANISNEYEINSEIRFPENFTKFYDILKCEYIELFNNSLFVNLKAYQFYIGRLEE